MKVASDVWGLQLSFFSFCNLSENELPATKMFHSVLRASWNGAGKINESVTNDHDCLSVCEPTASLIFFFLSF